MTKLNQMVAVRKGLRARSEQAATAIYHQLQKPALYAGLARTYQPRAEDGENLPAERQAVQRTVEGDLAKVAATLSDLFDVVATVDYGNREATADVVVDGEALIASAPVPFLIFLEKQLVDLRTIVGKVPTLAPEDVWEPDPLNGGARSAPAVTTRARKIPTAFTKAPATDKHPAQVEVFMRDEIVGDWTLTKFSGAVSAVRRDAILTKIDLAVDAVRKATEAANDIEVTPLRDMAGSLFEFLLSE